MLNGSSMEGGLFVDEAALSPAAAVHLKAAPGRWSRVDRGQ